jgi:hypothetical protein
MVLHSFCLSSVCKMILAHTWDAFGFPCKIGCDIGTCATCTIHTSSLEDTGAIAATQAHSQAHTLVYSPLYALQFPPPPRSCAAIRAEDLAKSSNCCSYGVSGLVALHVPPWVGIESSPRIWAAVRHVSLLNSDTCWSNVESTLRSGIDCFDWVPSWGTLDAVFFFARWVLSTYQS